MFTVTHTWHAICCAPCLPLEEALFNYSGFANVLARDGSIPGDPGFLRSSSFGRALTTPGGVFGSGGPRAFQLGLRAQF
jgi:hypothetical protein